MNLPKGWVKTDLQTIGKIVTGKTPSKKNIDFYGGNYLLVKPGDLDKDILVAETEDRLTKLGLENVPAIPKGSVMVTCIGNMGKVGIASQTLATNQQINSIIPNKELIDSKYLYYFSKTLKSWLEKESSATTISIINKSKFSRAPILLPPLNEQKRIAQKLDSLLSTVENIKTRLNNTQAILKRFRQSTLAAATSGKLTQKWRRENGVNNKWENVEIGNLFSELRQGWSPKCENTPVSNNEWGVIKTSSVQSLNFIETENKKLPSILLPKESLSLKKGDILITRAGPRVRCAVSSYVHKDFDNLMICDKVYRIRVDNEKAISKYIVFVLNAPKYLKELEVMKTGISDSGLNLTQKKFKSMLIDIPNVKEQKEIVSKVESLFALADSIEAKIEAAQKRVDKLTQSILAKAFRGELVPQDPNDEPAQILLERIKAEQEAKKTKKRSKKSK